MKLLIILGLGLLSTAADRSLDAGNDSGVLSSHKDLPIDERRIVEDGTLPEAPEQSGDGGSGADSTPTAISDGTVDVISGRVATLDPVGDVTGVRIVSGVEHGTITVNPDNTFALVMTLSDFTGSQSFTYEATHADDSITIHQVDLNVTPGLQDSGWGTSESHYMLGTDINDRVVVEHGDDHTKVFISGSSNALSRTDIAAIEGISTSQINGQWLLANGYGQSEELALDADAGMALWKTVTPENSENSNWLLLERGYEYDLGRILGRGADGESELHPLYIGAYGDGDKPEIVSQFYQLQASTTNLVVQDIHFSGGVRIFDAENIIFDNASFSEAESSIQTSSGITIRNSDFTDVIRAVSKDGGDWEPHSDRVQSLYTNDIDGLLLEGDFFDHTGWQEGYDFDGSGSAPQPPSMFSHNIYLSHDNYDVTLRDTISMRAASVGAQVRPGGFIEDNLFLDNNIGVNFLGGGGDGSGSYTLFADNVVTSAGHKEADQVGALGWGADSQGQLSSLVDTIITHLADPNNQEEQAEKDSGGWSYKQSENSYYDDTIAYNWSLPEYNTDGLDPNVLDQTTIQLFTAQLLGQETATIEDLANYLRAQADGALDGVVDADLIIRFFQEGFGIAPDIRTEADTLRFIPNDLGDGVRWDNRLNWDTEDLPGTQDGDSIDLGGNHVIYGGTTEIDTLDFGPGGRLDFFHGKLTATAGLVAEEDGYVEIDQAGQLWTEGSTGAGDIHIGVGGGRFVNTGEMENAHLLANGGQTILATGGAEYDVGASKTLAVFAEAAKVGFDGDDGGMAILDMHEGATLAYAAQDGGLGTIEEFRSGAFGDNPDVLSGIDLGNATLEIDLSGLSADAGAAFTLMDSDELVGLFDEATMDIGGLGARDATIVVDYLNDSVTLELTAGSGQVSVETLGEEADVDAGEDALWTALTADQGVFSETAAAEVLDEDELLVDAA